MFENYLATKEDLESVEEALKYVWDPKMNFVFKDKSKIKNVITISYDSKFIYVWSPKKHGRYNLQKIPKKLKLKDELQDFWASGIISEKIQKPLPNRLQGKNRFTNPKISGGLLTPFIKLQKKRNRKYNPYVTKESYLATIIHEFGHVYWDAHKLWWFSNKQKNLGYLKTALKLYKGQK